MAKRILIRATGIIPFKGQLSGIGRSNVELISSMLDIGDPELEFSIYVPRLNSLKFRKYYDWKVNYYPFPFPNKLSNKNTNFEAWFRNKIIGYDLFHLTDNFDNVIASENFVATIHDLMLFNEDEWNRGTFQKIGRLSKRIVTCSEFTKMDICEKLIVPEEKVEVIPWGISHDVFKPFHSNSKEVLSSLGINNRFFFSCSCAHPRKNAIYSLRGFKKFAEEKNDISFVLVWKNLPREIKEEFCNEINDGKIIFLDTVSDKVLSILYANALTTFFVSSFEGFGFPILESMACGTPVVTCQNSSLGEIGGPLARYVREKNVDDIISEMDYFYNADKVDSVSLIDYSMGFSWKETAAKYINFYKRNL